VAKFSGIEARLVPLEAQALSPEAMLAAVTERTKIVFVCNPNNPTGSWWNRASLERFLAALDDRALVVLDEAYREFLDDPDFPDGLEVMERHANVLVFRTFSKMYGLAGFRIGYLGGSLEAVDIVRRTHIAYSVNSPGQIAAMAALADDAGHIVATRRMVDEAKSFLRDLFDSLGLEYVSGAGQLPHGPHAALRYPALSQAHAGRRDGAYHDRLSLPQLDSRVPGPATGHGSLCQGSNQGPGPRMNARTPGWAGSGDSAHKERSPLVEITAQLVMRGCLRRPKDCALWNPVMRVARCNATVEH